MYLRKIRSIIRGMVVCGVKDLEVSRGKPLYSQIVVKNWQAPAIVRMLLFFSQLLLRGFHHVSI